MGFVPCHVGISPCAEISPKELLIPIDIRVAHEWPCRQSLTLPGVDEGFTFLPTRNSIRMFAQCNNEGFTFLPTRNNEGFTFLPTRNKTNSMCAHGDVKNRLANNVVHPQPLVLAFPLSQHGWVVTRGVGGNVSWVMANGARLRIVSGDSHVGWIGRGSPQRLIRRKKG